MGAADGPTARSMLIRDGSSLEPCDFMLGGEAT
jgi:hypothetical protein